MEATAKMTRTAHEQAAQDWAGADKTGSLTSVACVR